MTTATPPKKATVAEVYKFFAGPGLTAEGTLVNPTADQKQRYPLARFRAEWEQLDPTFRLQLAVGIGTGTLTY